MIDNVFIFTEIFNCGKLLKILKFLKFLYSHIIIPIIKKLWRFVILFVTFLRPQHLYMYMLGSRKILRRFKNVRLSAESNLRLEEDKRRQLNLGSIFAVEHFGI